MLWLQRRFLPSQFSLLKTNKPITPQPAVPHTAAGRTPLRLTAVLLPAPHPSVLKSLPPQAPLPFPVPEAQTGAPDAAPTGSRQQEGSL